METFGSTLRAARSLLNLSRKKVEEAFGIPVGMLARLERGEIKQLPRDAHKIQARFEQLGIVFDKCTPPYVACVRLKAELENDPLRTAQIRAGRMVTNKSQARFAELAGVDKNVIARLEKDLPKRLSMETVVKIENALNELGVELVPGNEVHGPGIKWTEQALAD